MRRVGWVVALGLGLAGCAPASQDRVRDYSLDGQLLFRQGRYADARESFQAALALRPDDAALLYNAGQCADRLGDAAAAEQFYNACLDKQSNHAAGRHALCALLVREGRNDEATGMVEAWLAREPKLAAAYAADGWLWHQAGDLPRAQARLQQALEIDPHDGFALVELALIYEEMHRPDRAAALYERALAQDPNQPDVAGRLNRLRAQGAGKPKPD
jgi:tetratricopeptide (TPR) repeat protein